MDPQPTNTNAKRLMIVDDDFEMRTLLAEYFRRLGFEVAEKESAAAALQTVTTESFDCFILDVSMPEMSGIELLKKLRDREIDTPALFLTVTFSVGRPGSCLPCCPTAWRGGWKPTAI